MIQRQPNWWAEEGYATIYRIVVTDMSKGTVQKD